MMKKRILILICICLATSINSQAQTPFQKEWSAGASFGVGFSSIGFSPSVSQSMLMGFNGGATVRWLTEKNLGLQFEINFAQQGWKEEFKEQPQYKYSRTINYIEFPFLTHIYFGSNKARFFLNLGPKVGYAFSESTDENLGGAEPNKYNKQHDMPIEKKFDWGLCGGPGFELRTGIGYFLLEGRYYMAFGNIYGSDKSDNFSGKSNPQVITVKLTYLIPFRK